MADIEVDKFDELISTKFSVETLKKEQREMINSLIRKRDCMSVLPTGYGKSLPYQMLIPLVRELHKCRTTSGELTEDLIIVCCPLVALMQDQVKRLENIPDLQVAYKGSSAESDEKIKNCEIDIVFASPESLVGDDQWRTQFQKLKVGTIVIDEFHTIASWGGVDIEEYQAFRIWFRHVGKLRSMFPSASVLALSATCTNKIRKRVIKYWD